MAVTTFIPKIWDARLLYHLDKQHVFARLVNRMYEGEIREYGDTVHINQIGDISIKDYTKGADIAAPDDLTTTEQLLVIDQAKYFNFGIDDVDAAQVRAPLMDAAMQRAAYGLADVTDQFVAKTMADGAGIKLGDTGSPIALTKTNAYDTLVQLKTLMDKANVPRDGRWIVVPPEFEGLILQDTRFATSFGDVANYRLVEGIVAKAAGFDIYVSNNVPVGTSADAGKYSIIASNNMSTTYAEQILKTEAFRPEKSFKDAIKGLHVYGAKVTQGGAVAKLTATFA